MSAKFRKNFNKYLKKKILKKEACGRATVVIKSKKIEQNHHMYMLFVNFNMPLLSYTQKIIQKTPYKHIISKIPYIRIISKLKRKKVTFFQIL